MIALSVKQPWANLIARGKKNIETRTWNTSYRGPLLICAGNAVDRDCLAWFKQLGVTDVEPRGVAVATANLVLVRVMGKEHEHNALVEARPGLFAWYLTNVQRIQPFPVRGQLGLFKVPIVEGQIIPYNPPARLGPC